MKFLNKPDCQRIHFIGIGGIGMCGLAEILLKQGYQVSGSDQHHSKITERLQNLGAEIVKGHDSTYINKADVIVYSSAISEHNVELLAAKEKNLPLFRRGELLAEIMANRQGIAIAGTHGKTTTTGMISHILIHTNLDPITINGGILQGGETTVHFGCGEYLVAEADESDGSFLLLKPKIAVITNIEADHLENYGGDFNQLQESFIQFAAQIPEDGVIIAGIDDPIVRTLVSKFEGKVITFGFSEDANVRASQFQQTNLNTIFRLESTGFESNLQWELSVPGQHNVLNALAAVCVGQYLNIDESILRKQLKSFPGMGRRFHLCGQLSTGNSGSAIVYTDYGHHPSELAMTIAAARAAWPKRRLVMVFQPHRFSRTQLLLLDFIKVLAQVDLLILLDIYGAGETPILGLDGEVLFNHLKSTGVNVHYLPELNQLAGKMIQVAQAEDVIFLQGAGNIGTEGVCGLSEYFMKENA